MKKYLLLIITCIFIFPMLVSAEVCQKDDIVISKVELNEVRGNAEETDNPNSNNNQININTSNSDYVFDKNQITKDYINYAISNEGILTIGTFNFYDSTIAGKTDAISGTITDQQTTISAGTIVVDNKTYQTNFNS